MCPPHPPAEAKRVLVVEDDAAFREVLTMGLNAAGIETVDAASVAEAIKKIETANAAGVQRAQGIAAVISDMRLGDESGLYLLAWMKEKNISIPSVIMTAYATTETTVQALSLGAVDFLTKSRDGIHDLVTVVQRILAEADALAMAEPEAFAVGELVGVSDEIRRIQALIGKYALADAAVLITGESGTGKDVAARLIHRYSARSKGPFVAVNCGALPENLLESELFGFEKGSFTGATATKRGLFEVASGGIIFLDEIGEMALPLQVKLLRVLQELKVRRIGADVERPIDVRVVCSTNRDIKEMAEGGTFRMDLYYRLNILTLELPPLRERLEDLPAFVSHFLSEACQRMGKPAMTLSQEALARLGGHGFPGNVRELKNIIERMAALGSGGILGVEALPEDVVAGAPKVAECPEAQAGMPTGGFDLNAYLKHWKGYYAHKALELSNGNKTRAAHMLGMAFRNFRNFVEAEGGADRLPTQPPRPEGYAGVGG